MKRFFAPPSSMHPSEQRIARIVLFITISTTLILAVANINPLFMVILAFFLGCALILVWQGRIHLAGVFAPAAGFMIFAYLIFSHLGIRDTAMLGLPVIIISASLMNGRWGALAFGVASLILVIALGILETRGWIVNVYSQTNTIADYFVVVIAIVITVIFQWALIERLNQHIQTARQELVGRTQTEIELKQRAEEISLLYQIGVALTSGQDLYHALRAFVKELRHLMIVDTFYVAIYDEQTDRISYPLYLNLDDDLRPPPRMLSENPGLTGVVIANRKTLMIPDITDPEILKRHKIVWIVKMDVHSYIGIPLMMDDRIIGVLSIQAREANAYSTQQVLLLETLAAQVAITVEKARLFEQLQQELTERKRVEAEIRELNAELETRVEKRTAELAAANKDLEAFSYSVSHDLRTPLRAIHGFSTLFEQQYLEQLDGAGQRFIHLILKNAHRMNLLIDDLLAFARLGRHPIRKQKVEPVGLVREVWEELELELNERQVIFSVEELPPCEADPALLRQVFANLLGNAYKYSRGREIATIQVGYQMLEDERVYLIRDNGVGFDMAYANKLFGVFQRLHGVDEFEGTGVGLAIVQRIIQRHGGRIWAEAEVNKGATFFFTMG